jgi:hypothetical protein
MTTRTRHEQSAVRQRLSHDFEDGLDPRELPDPEAVWLDKLRTERARRTSLDFYDYVELMGF